MNYLGAVRIRIRSLLAAMDMGREKHIKAWPAPQQYSRVEFTKQMFDEGYTILAPQMSPIRFDLLEPVFRKHGCNIVLLDNDNREAIDTGLKFVNNDACFPSITVVGQITKPFLSLGNQYGEGWFLTGEMVELSRPAHPASSASSLLRACRTMWRARASSRR